LGTSLNSSPLRVMQHYLGEVVSDKSYAQDFSAQKQQ
jgi:hypothetical protein